MRKGDFLLREDGGNTSLPAHQITYAGPVSVQGTTCVDCRADVLSDEGDQGRVFEGSTLADAASTFEFLSATRFHGPHVTCTATDLDGTTSEFSEPAAL